MDRYNLRSGTVATAVTSSYLRVVASEQTEQDRLAGYAVGDTAQLSSDVIAPNLPEKGEFQPHPWPLRQRHPILEQPKNRLHCLEPRAKSRLLTALFRPGHSRRRARFPLFLVRFGRLNMNLAHLRPYTHFTHHRPQRRHTPFRNKLK